MDKEKKDTTQAVRPLTWPIRTANSDIEQSHSLKKKTRTAELIATSCAGRLPQPLRLQLTPSIS